MSELTETTDLAGQGALTEAGAVAVLAQEAAAPDELDPNKTYSLLVPDGDHVELLDLEYRLPAPERARGTYRPATVGALIDHVTRHYDKDHTTIWVHPTSGRIAAVFNDTAPGEGATPGWRDHCSQLDLRHTDEWLFWRSKDGQLVSQTEFAEHIEDGVKEIVEPAAADMLELAQSFQAAASASFRSATRLADGTVQMQYDEQLDAKAGRSGEIPIPTEFTLAIAPFLGEEPYKITARLRYRLTSGTLRLGYRLERPNDVVRDALEQIAARLTDRFTHVFLGEPAGEIA